MSSEVWSKGSFHLAADDHDHNRKMEKTITHEVKTKQNKKKPDRLTQKKYMR